MCVQNASSSASKTRGDMGTSASSGGGGQPLGRRHDVRNTRRIEVRRSMTARARRRHTRPPAAGCAATARTAPCRAATLTRAPPAAASAPRAGPERVPRRPDDRGAAPARREARQLPGRRRAARRRGEGAPRSPPFPPNLSLSLAPPPPPCLLRRLDGARLATQARRQERKRLRRELKEQQRVAADAARSSGADDADGDTVSAERRESADSTPLLVSRSGSAFEAYAPAPLGDSDLGDGIAVEHIE